MSPRWRFTAALTVGATFFAAAVAALFAYSAPAERGAGAALRAAPEAVAAAAQWQDSSTPASANDMVTKQAQAAVDKGLEWLAATQGQGGGFGSSQYKVAISALAGLAFMSAGHQPGRGKYGDVVTRTIEFILNQEQNFDASGRPTPGFLYFRGGKLPNGAMYEHGFGTMFLAEAYGMVYDRDLRDRVGATLRRAVALTIRAQNADGGWRYSPFSAEADLSVTICQIMALRAARNAGITVPSSVSKRCINYVKYCQLPNRGGAFQYMKQGGHISFPLTAAGVVALFSAGVYKDEAIVRGLDFLKQYRPGQAAPMDQMFAMHYYYGHYYAAQAMWIAGGNYWREWYPAVRDELLSKRRADGSWYDGRMDPHFCTAMALIVLQMPNNYLPIFQR